MNPATPLAARRYRSKLSFVVAAAVLASCGAEPPTASTPLAASPPPSASGRTTGQVVDVLSVSPLPGVSVNVNGSTAATTDANGGFALEQPSAAVLAATFAGLGFVDRRTFLRVPGPHAVVSLIASNIDLASFDQMFRASGGLHRWTSRPALVIVRRPLIFTNASDDSFVASSEDLLAPDEEARLIEDLTGGLVDLTAGALSSFAAVAFDTPEPGARVNVKRADAIVVGRYRGLTDATTYWGYGRWSTRGEAVAGGIILVDADFDSSGTRYRRSLRVHELGHALGCDHVTLRASVMNPDARSMPNDRDREAARIAFQRPPGNRAPDVDPDTAAANRALSRGIRWGAPIP